METFRPVNRLLLQYSYLQLLDLMTTIAFLLNGLKEGNPLVRLALRYSANPLEALVAVKAVALLLGVYCWWMGRDRLLTRINFLFALLVVWNLFALIAGSALLRS